MCRLGGDFFFRRYAKLRTLSLRGNGMRDAACVILAEGLDENVRLRVIRLECNAIGDKGAASVLCVVRVRVAAGTALPLACEAIRADSSTTQLPPRGALPRCTVAGLTRDLSF